MTNERQRGFERVAEPFRKLGETAFFRLPLRATRASAGYDFFAPEDIDIPPQTSMGFVLDIKAYMNPDEMLLILPRSSVGIKLGLMIANTVGIGDADYYANPDNDGNYRIQLRNLQPETRLKGFRTIQLANGEDCAMPELEDLREKNTVHIKAGDRVAQGIFVKVLRADDGNSEAERAGGLGSTGE